MAVLLIAEDEKDMQNIIVDFMQQGGHSCILANDGVEALSILENNTVDLIILDIMMPQLDGFTVCKFARNICDVPIIFLTAKSEENDKLKGYEYGADDYVTKPFSPKILLAKVNAWLRHTTMANSHDILSAGEIMLYPSAHTVIVSGNEVELTHKEYELLHLFLQNKSNRSIIPRYRKVVVPGTHTAENHDFISPDQGSRSSISKSLRCATRSGNTLSR